MMFDNPWIELECQYYWVPHNKLGTHLQEQYGQLGEDLVLEVFLKSYFSRKGLDLNLIRYLDIGANHSIQTSNTYLFYHK